ncbi:hypothetical protein A2276_03170 [candidate division WOR-1 bacterium RIFOXYA12_FULL_43_27]|uniref:General secretion pathway GspH domain-containing protein n=1 Tax=candidate division WOR-1 bacterium RIFOXYC2_FULL_46_14 TaxID=1802587 RepID=A0A1F4U7N2_UNCSA|nr:MAG: hypothetical protein A2276_03170 [candidate division WOR-1 bacterium RIFOXYA12_FULL_43_27]OGC19297.1 MAG: hypothetical protein A2292_01165 [candidate division WOR-1 bacterium RIFOXYB2_FULL_46_45]OGC30286.1 MAG: hypothetical protein A2232_01165 [candidate division WOR-1 bacterium RIFOXYA2_FULL_46_56]OGC40887.1 MAG: hypothetical protein A2438_01165 [candidate division WOR-1 bacterium RIFOXYC2_FULL_46_14]
MRKGFTIIELAMVIALLAIVAITVNIVFRGSGTHMLDAASQKIASDIRYAQNLAVSHRDWYGIRFNAGQNSYYLFHYDPSYASEEAVTDPVKMGANFSVNLGETYSGVTLSSVLCNSSILYDYIIFSADGVPSNNLGGEFLSRSDIQISHSNGSGRSVYVAPRSGKVSIN